MNLPLLIYNIVPVGDTKCVTPVTLLVLHNITGVAYSLNTLKEYIILFNNDENYFSLSTDLFTALIGGSINIKKILYLKRYWCYIPEYV